MAVKPYIRFVFCLIALIPLQIYSQCNINALSNGCLDDLVSFKVSSGQTITATQWDFGDGNTSTQSAPGYKYNVAKAYTVTAIVTLQNGTKCTATHNIIIHPKPISNFSVNGNSSFCFNKNKVCITDNSTPGATGNPIAQRVFLWDDGAGDNSTNPSAQKVLCHTYFQTGTYTLIMETTDDKGCIAKSSQKITVQPDYDADMAYDLTVNPSDCKFTVCFTNKTKPKDTANVSSYLWDFGDGNSNNNMVNYDSVCHVYPNSGNYTAKLIVTHKSGCSDTAFTTINITKPKINFKLKIPDSVCLGTIGQFLNDTTNNGAMYRWFIRDSATNLERPIQGLNNPIDVSFTTPGKFYIKLNILVDNCQQNGYDSVVVRCPSAGLLPLNNRLCDAGDTTYFCNSSCYYQSYNYKQIWDYGHGEACTTDTKNGINTNRNCRFSVDNNGKHLYGFTDTSKSYACFTPSLYIVDTVTGCESTGSNLVMLGMPPLDSLKVVEQVSEYCTDIGGVNSERIVNFLISGLSCNQAWNMYLNFDSARGKDMFAKVTPYPPPQFRYTYTGNPTGDVTIGFVVQNGNPTVSKSCFDTLTIKGKTCEDTVWYHHKFNMAAVPNPNVGLYDDKGCAPFNFTVRPEDTVQYGVHKIKWEWGDGTADSLELTPGDTIMPVRYHTYQKNGLYTVMLTMANTKGCSETEFLLVGLGYDNFVEYDSIVCAGDSVELKEYVSYYDKANPFWKDSARLAQPNKEKLFWDFDDGNGFVTKKPETKVVFANEGTYRVRMATEDSTACRDTFTFYIRAVKADAYIRSMKDTFYCNDNIIRFYDSSFGSPQIPGDVVVGWHWEFGDFKTPSYLKDPYHFYSSYGQKVISVAVKSAAGCRDTAYKTIYIDGPVPYFEIISDSVGCDPLKIELDNTSKRVTTWIWSMGDPANTTINTDKDSNIKFTYTPPGTYYIKLYGADSIYNPNTGNTYFCSATYPDTPLVKKVVVIPNYPVGMDIPDTICQNNPAIIKSVSASRYDDFRWWMGNGDSVFTDTETFVYIYPDAGNFRIDFKPTYAPNQWERLCIADTFKDITVIPIEADFEINPNSKEPVFYFTNKSTNAVRYEWDFGHPASGNDNKSTLKDPSHNYKTNLGTFTVCLRAYNKEECVDTVCKQVSNNYLPRLFIPNAFSPQGNDTTNLRFDIDIYLAGYYHLNIFNRWGEKVFEGFEDGEGNLDGLNWDGKHFITGSLCPSGVYFVVFEYEIVGLEGKNTYKGTLNLFREE